MRPERYPVGGLVVQRIAQQRDFSASPRMAWLMNRDRFERRVAADWRNRMEAYSLGMTKEQYHAFSRHVAEMKWRIADLRGRMVLHVQALEQGGRELQELQELEERQRRMEQILARDP
jgi:hypothetical protein